MRHDLMPQDNNRVLGLQAQGPLDRQWPKAVERAVNREVARGLQGAARAQAVGYITTARVEAAEMVTERAMPLLPQGGQARDHSATWIRTSVRSFGRQP